MNRALPSVAIAFLAACGCARGARPAAPSPTPVALGTPRWTVVPLDVGERPDVLVVDWSAAAPSARRYGWVASRALVLGAAPREASFRVFRRTHLEWLVPVDLDVSPEAQVVGFLGGIARDIDVRFARLECSAAALTEGGDLAQRLDVGESSRSDVGSLMTR